MSEAFSVRNVNKMFFFFQAEYGIRSLYVTGVQTCALPICAGIGEDVRGPAWRAAAVAGAAGLVAWMRAATSGFTDAARETRMSRRSCVHQAFCLRRR